MRRTHDHWAMLNSSFSVTGGSTSKHVDACACPPLQELPAAANGERLFRRSGRRAAIDDAHTVLHRRDRICTDDVAVRSVSGVCKRDEVRARATSSSNSTFSTPEFRGTRLRQEGIKGHDMHLQADAAHGDDRTDMCRSR